MEKYKLTKTIRFKLKPKDISAIKRDVEALEQQKFDLVLFVYNLHNFIGKLKEYLFFQKEKDEFVIKDKLTIKKTWLKQYAKQEIAGLELNREQTLGNIKGVSARIERAVDDVNKIYVELAMEAKLNERAKKAKTEQLIKRLDTRNALPLLVSLIEQSSDKYETGNLSIQLKRLGKRLQTQLLSGIKKYLAEQSNGLPIAKASFNYYAINKKPVDYIDKIKQLQKDLEIKKNRRSERAL